MSEMKKIVFKDNQQTKAIVGEIINEDSFFITLKAISSGTEFRIGKSYVISIRDMDVKN
jgi:hypothetical protein